VRKLSIFLSCIKYNPKKNNPESECSERNTTTNTKKDCVKPIDIHFTLLKRLGSNCTPILAKPSTYTEGFRVSEEGIAVRNNSL